MPEPRALTPDERDAIEARDLMLAPWKLVRGAWMAQRMTADYEYVSQVEADRHVLLDALRAAEAERDRLRATIEAMSGDAADLHDLLGEAAALRTALAHALVRVHDSGCGMCDAARALLSATHELPSFAALSPVQEATDA